MRTYHIPIFVPHKGCPHDCVFCNQRHITGHTADVTSEDVSKIIESHLATLEENSYAEAAFFGGSFTGIELSKQNELLEEAYSYVADGSIKGIRCSTRPDYIDEEIIINLKKYSVSCIELGVQSTDSEVLKRSRRGHSFEEVVYASKLIKESGIELGLQMMLGLPGDTKDKMIKTAKNLISLEPSCVRIYPTLVVEDTALWNMFRRGDYIPLTLEEAVDILSDIIPMFEKNNIKIIRVGLQTTDDINENTVEGPYHPAIRELAEGRIIRKLLEQYVNYDVLEVSASKNRISQVSGHKRCNKLYFKEKYGLELKITEDKELPDNSLKICNNFVAIY